MIRFLDFSISLVGIIVTFPLLVVLYFIGLFDTGSPIFRQVRVGRNLKPFTLIKFRTMKVEAASVASHLADRTMVTRYGSFLRKSKLDELPQLLNVLKGEMSLVGPRPGLFNQQELLNERKKLDIFDVRPGITGLAQVNCIDMSTPKELAAKDKQMIESLSLKTYVKLILATVKGDGKGDRIK